jgi:hypothetical protein
MALHQNGTSSTCVISPDPIQLTYLSKPQDAKVAGSHTSLRLSDSKGSQNDDPVENLPSPTTQAAEKLERWNHPRSNLFRTMAAFWGFVVMGSNDAAYGALIPYLQEYYFDLPITVGGIYGICVAQQFHSFEVWAEGCCSYCADVPFDCVYRYRGASAVSSVGGYLQ